MLNDHRNHPRIYVGSVFVGVLLIMSFIAFRAYTSDAPTAPPPAFTHEGNKIIVPENSPLRSHLVVAPVETKIIPHTLLLPAAVEADPSHTVNILPPLTGRITELKVQLGDHVEKGQPLAVIDSGDLAQAYADNDKARDMLNLTQRALDRARGSARAGGGTVKDLEQAESDYAQAKAEAERAETRLKDLGVPADVQGNSRVLTVMAPASGSLTTLSVAAGDFVNDLTATMMTISDLDTVWVTANVPEKDIAFVSAEQPVTVTLDAYPGKVFSGKILFISNVLDPDTRRVKVRIAFPNSDGLFKPGMFAKATFTAPQVERLFVPTSALLMSNEKTTVFIETAPWTFERRAVEMDYQEGSSFTVKSGLNANDRVIVKGGVLLND